MSGGERYRPAADGAPTGGGLSMEKGRRYGIVGSSEGSLSDLEKYLNETSGEPEGIESTLDSAITESLNLPDNAHVNMRVWRFKKDPWQFYSKDGQLVFSLENIRFTNIRADDHQGGDRCAGILRFDWSVHTDTDILVSNQNIPVQLRINAADGTVLHDWEPGRVTPTVDWLRRPVSYLQDINPALFDRIGGAGLYLFFYNARLYEC
jgi:hypothetical protein